MDATTMLERAMQANQELIASLTPADYAKPTPCWGWDVKALVNHMIGVNGYFAATLTGQPPAAGTEPPSFTGAAAVEAHAKSMQAALAGWRTPGALDRMLSVGPNSMPGSTVIRFNQGDHVTHHWDLCKALGRQPALDADLVEYTNETFRSNLQPDFRGPGRAFGYEVACPDTASPLDRLAAFSGRQP